MGGPGHITVWTGSAFDCPEANNIIYQLHNYAPAESYRRCNNGAIVARIFSVEGNNYTSQLNVTFTSKTMGKTVECHHDNGFTSIFLFSLVIPTTGLSPCTHTAS